MPGSASPLGRVLRVLAAPAVLLVGIGGFVAFARSREEPQPVAVETPIPLVETVTVTQTSDSFEINADGVVVPFRSVVVSAEVAGRVIEKSDAFRPGRTVKAGDLLLRIDPSDYELQIARLESERDQAQANINELTVQIANTEASIEIAKEELELNRDELARLVRGERTGAITVQARDAAKRKELASRTTVTNLESEKRLLEAQRVRLQQALKLAETQIEEAKLDLARTVVRAPLDGLVMSVNVEEDGYLKAGDPIAELDDTSAVEVRTNLEMRALAWLRANMPADSVESLGAYEIPPVPVTITYEVLGNTYSWRGVLSRLDGAGVDPRTRTVPCRVLVSEPQAVSLRSGTSDLPVAAPTALMRGMFVKVLLHTRPTVPLLSVPELAVRPGNTVWAVRDDKLLHFELPAARVMRGSVLVSPQVTQLRAGDQVVTSPIVAAKEGMTVRVQRSDAEANDASAPGRQFAGEPGAAREENVRR